MNGIYKGLNHPFYLLPLPLSKKGVLKQVITYCVQSLIYVCKFYVNYKLDTQIILHYILCIILSKISSLNYISLGKEHSASDNCSVNGENKTQKNIRSFHHFPFDKYC